MDRIPFLVFGDGPRLHSGLARIARDLAVRLYAEQEALGIQFLQVGVDYPVGWHWQPWDFYGFQPIAGGDQGRGAVTEVVAECRQAQPDVAPIVLTIMDPSRIYDLTREARPDGEKELETSRIWGYAPVDAHNRHGSLGGPAAVAVRQLERVLGYGRYGAQVLAQVLRDSPTTTSQTGVPWLPHGIETHAFRPGVPLTAAHPGFQAWAQGVPPQALKIGAVATNQPRKDLGLLFQTIAELRRTQPVVLWLHTDRETHAWSISELVATCGLGRDEVAISVDQISDAELAARYGWSDVTIAPGLGEGFGYPIVESLACGTPVVHGDYAGGVELIPNRRWLCPVYSYRLESVYAIKRPVLRPEDLADTVQRAAADAQDPACAAFCAGSVAHLDWQYLWPRWATWIRKGLTRP